MKLIIIIKKTIITILIILSILSCKKKIKPIVEDKDLIAILDSVFQEDQKYRRLTSKIEKEFGSGSEKLKNHWKLIQEKDSINLIKVKKILNTRGWLGFKTIGENGNTTLFVVIQHADIKTQLKYLPMMRDAVKKGNALASDLALLEDRVNIGQGKKQVYGSQIDRDKETGKYFVSPILDPKNVDKRRASIGLNPIADYVSMWNITWNVKKHKERAIKIENK